MHIAILGINPPTLKSYLNSKGHRYHSFIDKRKQKSNIVNDDISYVDYKDENETIKIIKQFHSDDKFDAIFTIYEKHIVFTAKIAELLGLRGMPLESAMACTNKALMRSLFLKAPSNISPQFRRIDCFEDAIDFAESHDFPLMLKPGNLAKSLLITKNANLEELRKNYNSMQSLMPTIYAKHAPDNEQIIIIEEFLDGSVHSVDAYVDENGLPQVLPSIVDYETGYDIGFDDNFHYSRILPTKLSVADQQELIAVAEQGINALGMKNSAAHIEIIMTKNGPKIVEIGARNGGYRDRMYRLANGIDTYGALLDILAGKEINVSAQKNDDCAVLEIFPKSSGYFKGITNEEALRDLASLDYINIKYKLGEPTGKSSAGFKAACVLALHHESHSKFLSDLQFIRQNVAVEVSDVPIG